MRGDILGLERRRRWCDEEKLEIILSVGVGGATVTYGSIISVYTGPDNTITALTDDGIDELKVMLRDARIKDQSPR